MKTKKLILVGDSALAEIAYEYFTYDSEYEVVAFSVEQEFLKRETFLGLPVVPFESLENLYSPKDHCVYAAMAYTQFNRLRTRIAAKAKAKGYALASYISSRAFVWRNAKIGEHCFIFEDNTIQPFVTIGDNCVLWSGNHIGHHSTIKDNCFISSHVVVSGYCEIGENCFIGVNSSIGNNINIGKDNWISPGVTLIKTTPPNSLFKANKTAPAPIGALEFFKIES